MTTHIVTLQARRLARLLTKPAMALMICAMAGQLTVTATEYQIKNVSLNEGLSQTTVTALNRDDRGFIWIGTNFGLNRYDDFHIDNYYHDPLDNTSIPDNNIAALFLDTHKRLWVAGEKGLAYQNEAENNFTRVTTDDGNPLNIRSFLEEPDGLLLGSADAIYFYEYATGKVAQIQAKGGSAVYYTKMSHWKPGKYILMTRWDGIWLFERATATITRFAPEPDRNISASCVDSNGRLWVAPYGEGVRCYSPDGELMLTLNTSNSALSSDIVLDIADYDNEIWIATDGGSINIYDPVEHKLTPPYDKPWNAAASSITKLYADDYGNMYAGTVHNGAVCIRKVAMHTFQGPESGPGRWAAITTLLRDKDEDGIIWCGDDGGGVIRHDERTASFTAIPSTAGMKVTGLAHFDNRTILISTFDRGFQLLDKKTLSVRQAPNSLRQLSERNAKRALVTGIASLTDNEIAIVTDRITIYDTHSDTYRDRPFTNSKKSGAMNIFYCHNGRLFCAGENFIAGFDIHTDQTSIIVDMDDDDRIYAANFDGNTKLYFAATNGLRFHDVRSGTGGCLEKELPGKVNSLAIEGSRLWMGATNNIYLRLLDTGNTIVFDHFDGASANEYMPEATFITPKHVYMGGVNGLLRINRSDIDSLMRYDSQVEISLADIEIDGISAYQRLHGNKIDIDANHSSLRISIIDKERNTMRRKMFRYYIEGNGDCSYIETLDRSINLNHLPVGNKYELSVACSTPEGGWTEPQKVATLNMLAPWWRTWWALATYILLLASAAIILIKAERRREKNRIEKQIDAYRNSSLRKQVGFMVNTAYALRTPLTLIYAPVKLLIEKLERGEQPDVLPELRGIYQNSKKMRDVINIALELHNIDASSPDTATDIHDINTAVKRAVDASSAEIALKKLNVTVTTDPAVLPIIYDGARIDTALRTLIQNAVKHSAEHNAITVRTKNLDKTIRIEIINAGEHLGSENEANLFSKSYVDDNSTFGTGLEFAYVKSIIEERGGSTGAYNNTDAPGVTIWLELPKVIERQSDSIAAGTDNVAAMTQPETSDTLVDSVDTSGLTVIVVEEDNDLCLFIAGQLKLYFKKVLHAFNGKDALLLVRQNLPDIVISSVILPIKSGIELCHDIKSSPDLSHIPVILLTALKEGPSMERGYNAGADSYLSKPFDMNVLMSRCKNLLLTRSVIRRRYTGTESATASAIDKPMPNANESFLMKIEKIIVDNLHSTDLGVDLIVENMHMSRSALYTKFKELTGRSIGSYINDFRLTRAKELLKDPSMSINEVAELLGFSSQRYFSTFFKEKTGLSPSAYRASLPSRQQP